LELIPEIKETQPKAAIIVLTGQDMQNSRLKKIHGVLTKSRLTAERLIEMITKQIRQTAHNID
jgi:DNA-binding NarL/FixJ family response regulator